MHYLLQATDNKHYVIIDFGNSLWSGYGNWHSTIEEAFQDAMDNSINCEDDEEPFMSSFNDAYAFCEALRQTPDCIDCEVIAELPILNMTIIKEKYPELFI